MDSVLDQIGEWLKELLVSGIMNQLTGLFDSVNTQVGDIATQVGTTPANFSPGVFAMIRNVSESVIIPVAGLILTFIACYELIQMIIDHNNLGNCAVFIKLNGVNNITAFDAVCFFALDIMKVFTDRLLQLGFADLQFAI